MTTQNVHKASEITLLSDVIFQISTISDISSPSGSLECRSSYDPVTLDGKAIMSKWERRRSLIAKMLASDKRA